MSAHPVEYQGKVWRTTEALFQALRFDREDIREIIRSQLSPMAAKMMAKSHAGLMKIVPRSSDDLALMKMILRLKVEQHPYLKRELLATGDALIVEDCSKRPNVSGLFWGAERAVDANGVEWWRGSNNLGHLWVQVRDELKNAG